MTAFPYLIQGSNIVVVIDGKSHTVSKTHPIYEKVKGAIKAGEWDTLLDIIEPKKVVLNYGKGNVTIQGETLYWKGNELNTGLAVRMINMLEEGFPIDPMVEFMENLMKNPSKRAVTELYGFMETGSLPITPDGHFLAYKKVMNNYMDVHSGTVLNKPADKMTAEEVASLSAKVFGKKNEVTVEIVNGETVISMERNAVDDDKDNTCSEGLHFCSEAYLSSFSGSRVMVMKINPADVVSIPSDYNDTKGRTAKYTVIGEISAGKAKDEVEFNKSVQSNANSLSPKEGNSEFYRGYWDGFNEVDFYDLGDRNYHEGYDKGDADRKNGYVAPLFVKDDVQNTEGMTQVKKDPKEGNSEFYRGYSDGFNDAYFDDNADADLGNLDYHEGYDKGEADHENGMPERYRYVAPLLNWPHSRNT